MKECFRCGLYKQGLLHDLSKYSWTEFSVGVKYYQGYTSAWLHHKGRNKHHLEYWIDYSMTPGAGLEGMEMPVKYVVEMFCDRVAACKNYHPDSYTDDAALAYYERGKNKYPMHPNTRELLERLLHMLADEGEEVTFDYIRTEVLKNKKRRTRG